METNYSNTELNDKNLLNLGLLLTVILFLIALVSLYTSRTIRHQYPEQTIVKELKSNPFNLVEIRAKSAIVINSKTGEVLFEKNADLRLPLASLTKIMTAVTALDLIPESKLITIDKTFLDPEGDSGFYIGEEWTVKDLLDLALVGSSNDAATALAATAGLKKISNENYALGRDEFLVLMNKKASELQMSTAWFYNETGLDVDKVVSGGYSSARDYSKLFKYAIERYPTIFEGTKENTFILTSASNVNHSVINTNKSTYSIPNLIASKTGYTDLAGGNLSIAFEPGLGDPIIVIVLGSTLDGRFADVRKLSVAALEYINSSY
jgi:D-alanyl-D-alanine carboxypeptidase